MNKDIYILFSISMLVTIFTVRVGKHNFDVIIIIITTIII